MVDDRALGHPSAYKTRAGDPVASLRRWAALLDSAFRLPGTRLRFGLDPLVGLIPGLGDLATPVFSILLLVHAVRLRIPRIVQLRMVLNALIDFGLGSLPLVGDAFDFVWKSNEMNLALLERHAGGGTTPSIGDWLFVAVVMVILVAAALVPVAIGLWLFSVLRRPVF